MTLNYLKYSIYIIIYLGVIGTCLSQDTRPASEFRSSSVYINYTNSIFNTPIEQYKYVKTHRGIEIYETYRHPTNGYINQTIFPKSMPVAVIKSNTVTKNLVIYKNYSNSIFNKPIEFVTIKNNTTSSSVNTKSKLTKDLPKYDGEGDISYGE